MQGAVRMAGRVTYSEGAVTVLGILDVRGPMLYSDLKSRAGFRAKQESGRFAYHLRKLLRSGLVSLDSQEKTYTITAVGRECLGMVDRVGCMMPFEQRPRAAGGEDMSAAMVRILHILDTAGSQTHSGLRRLAGLEGDGEAAAFDRHLGRLLGMRLVSLYLPYIRYSITDGGRTALGRRP